MSTQQNYLTSIANAIRTKLNSSASIQASTFASKIGEIVSLRKEIGIKASDTSSTVTATLSGSATGSIHISIQSAPYFSGYVLRIPVTMDGSGGANRTGSIYVDGSGEISVNLSNIIK